VKNNQYQNFKLLCSFLRTEEGSQHPSYTENEIKKIDWEKLFQLADGYLVLPALYLGLKRKGYLKSLDQEAHNFLKTIYGFNCEHNQKLKEEALSVIRILNSQEIQPVLLKGVAGLLTGLYEEDGERIIGDIDLLVDQLEVAKVVRLLIGHGYHCDKEVSERVFEGDFIRHELTIMTESHSVKIDLHVRPAGSSGKKTFISVAEAREGAQVVDVEGARALLPPPFFRLMHNFYHAQHIDRSYLSGQIHLRQLIDWVKLWKQYGSEVGLAKINSKVRWYRKFLSYRLYLLNAWRLLKLPIPKGIKISWMERLLFRRQELCVQNAWFNRVNGVSVYVASAPLLLTPESLRQSFGDLPLRSLIKMRTKKLLEPGWYLRRMKEIKKL